MLKHLMETNGKGNRETQHQTNLCKLFQFMSVCIVGGGNEQLHLSTTLLTEEKSSETHPCCV